MFKRLVFVKMRPFLKPDTFLRCLSVSETATALRPFFFAVHPDLFGQYPEERAVNEDSLKHLQQYLEGLHTQRRVQAPSRLTFYVRDTKERTKSVLGGNNLRKVQIELLTRTVRDTVTTVLKSCDLSLDYVNEVPSAKKGPDRPIRWDPTFYTFYGIPNPFAPRRQPKMEDSLSSWLDRNLTKARRNLDMVEPVRQQTTRMVTALKAATGLRAVRWDSSWGPAQFRACLLSLSRLCKQHSDQLELTGLTVVFTNETGVSLHGEVLLRSDDVPDTWLRVLKSRTQHQAVLAQIPQAEAQLSEVLHGVRVARGSAGGPLVVAGEYLGQVRRLTDTVRRHLADQDGGRLVYEDLSDISILIKCATGSLSMSPSGLVVIPSSCPGFMLIDYLNRNTAKLRNHQDKRCGKERTELVGRVIEAFSLLSLSRDQNVTWPQMEQACTRLLGLSPTLSTCLAGCRLRVAQFYSVMSDGEIYIPWNWKEGSDGG